MSKATNKDILVWDPLVRVFHWSLASFFFIAYVSEDDYMSIHSWAGYGVANTHHGSLYKVALESLN